MNSINNDIIFHLNSLTNLNRYLFYKKEINNSSSNYKYNDMWICEMLISSNEKYDKLYGYYTEFIHDHPNFVIVFIGIPRILSNGEFFYLDLLNYKERANNSQAIFIDGKLISLKKLGREKISYNESNLLELHYAYTFYLN